jgi:hypothetical protein
MKNLLLFSSILAFSLFTNCKKKSNDPAPVATTVPKTVTKTPPTTQFGTTSGISSNGKITPVTTKSYYQGSIYTIEGIDAGETFTIDAEFPNGQPTKSLTIDLATSTFNLFYVTMSSDLKANSGTANVVVSDTAIIITFMNAVFTDLATTMKYTYSAQLIVPIKTTTGGSITIGGNTSTLLYVEASGDGTGYSISGYTSTDDFFAANFNTMPTATVTEDLSKGSTNNINLSYSASNSNYTLTPVSGSATTTVNGTSITVTFTNAVFTDGNGNETKTISGTIY